MYQSGRDQQIISVVTPRFSLLFSCTKFSKTHLKQGSIFVSLL